MKTRTPRWIRKRARSRLLTLCAPALACCSQPGGMPGAPPAGGGGGGPNIEEVSRPGPPARPREAPSLSAAAAHARRPLTSRAHLSRACLRSFRSTKALPSLASRPCCDRGFFLGGHLGGRSTWAASSGLAILGGVASGSRSRARRRALVLRRRRAVGGAAAHGMEPSAAGSRLGSADREAEES